LCLTSQRNKEKTNNERIFKQMQHFPKIFCAFAPSKSREQGKRIKFLGCFVCEIRYKSGFFTSPFSVQPFGLRGGCFRFIPQSLRFIGGYSYFVLRTAAIGGVM